jgi:cytochrome c-type biogenesis protein
MNLPTRLSDVVLLDEKGSPKPLLARMENERAVLNFYAPWCGPCQEELPELVREFEDQPVDLFVVIGKDEDPVDTRRKFDNLGLSEVGFLIDSTGELVRTAQVRALPTTFVITEPGAVELRLSGYSRMGMWRLKDVALGEREESGSIGAGGAAP